MYFLENKKSDTPKKKTRKNKKTNKQTNLSNDF